MTTFQKSQKSNHGRGPVPLTHCRLGHERCTKTRLVPSTVCFSNHRGLEGFRTPNTIILGLSLNSQAAHSRQTLSAQRILLNTR